MSDTQSTHHDRVLRVRLAADPASVPGARQFVAEGLRAWGREELLDDAALCVSELAGNAALHARSTYIEVCVVDLERGVRVCVEDDGPAAVSVVAPRPVLPGQSGGTTEDGPSDELSEELDDLELLLDAPATGRGLAIVSVLASDWGVEELEHGKRVWADLAPGSVPGAAPAAPEIRPVMSPSTPRAAKAATESREPLPEGWVSVRLAGCPVELSLRQDQHLDELVRELTLMSGDQRRLGSAALARRLEAILRAPAHARAAGRLQAQEALARGEEYVDVEMAMPREFAREVRDLDKAVHDADVLCERSRLLTLASPPRMREFRAWMTEQILAQVEQGATPVTWTDWLARR